MKKWIFVVGISCSAIMFLISGTLIGYATHDKKDIPQSSQNEKSSRKLRVPNINNVPLLSSQLRKPIIPLSKSRLPSGSALLMANNYNRLNR
ncbi:MAG: hypothetical protein LBL32_00080 [Holosporales bacterium]|nr:hypothetical protein [Holosporales bacterium]